MCEICWSRRHCRQSSTFSHSVYLLWHDPLFKLWSIVNLESPTMLHPGRYMLRAIVGSFVQHFVQTKRERNGPVIHIYGQRSAAASIRCVVTLQHWVLEQFRFRDGVVKVVLVHFGDLRGRRVGKASCWLTVLWFGTQSCGKRVHRKTFGARFFAACQSETYRR